jgi:isoquinoline 1-oxidoreductase beta subunit
VAQIAEVSLDQSGQSNRGVCAVDCGIAVNREMIRAQMEGGIGFGVGAVNRSSRWRAAPFKRVISTDMTFYA